MQKEFPTIFAKYAALPFLLQVLIALCFVAPIKWSYAWITQNPETLKALLLSQTPYSSSRKDVHEALEKEWSDQGPKVSEWCAEGNVEHRFSDEVIMHVAYYEPIVPFSVLAVFCFDQNQRLKKVRMKRTWDWW